MTTSLRAALGLALAVLLLLPAPPAGHAAGIPVADTETALAVLALLDIYLRQEDELKAAQRLVQSLTNPTNYGTSLDTAALRALRRALPTQMRDLTHLHSLASNPSLARSLALYGDLTDRYGLMEDEAYEPAQPNAPYAQAWRADRDAQLGAAVSSGVVYDNLAERERFYETAMTELDTREDLKQSVDLLTRVTAENGRVLMELIRVQTAASQATVTARLNEQAHTAKMRKMGTYEDKDLAYW